MPAPNREPSPDPLPYAEPAFAATLVHMGTPIPLLRSGGSLLRRAIPGTTAADASGPYPLLSLRSIEHLAEDLEGLDREIVSVTAVLDPLESKAETMGALAFPDLFRVFKQHFVTDLEVPHDETASHHHRRDARRGLRNVQVQCLVGAEIPWDDWWQLYALLVERHGITGPAAFPRESFERLAAVPGLLAYRASIGDETVGMQLWLRRGETASYHLAATNAAGYTKGAAYALMSFALDHLRQSGVKLAHLGAGAGTTGDESDGLTRFKRGWASGTLPAFLGGRILDPVRYGELSQALRRDPAGSGFFPLYRTPGR